MRETVDPVKAKFAIDKGRRSKWWRRLGSKPRNLKYTDSTGKPIKDPAYLERIRALVIPPAWKFVRINPSVGGKIQVVGMDADGRVQYRYSTAFAQKQQRKKFEKIEAFGKALPKLKKITNEHLALQGLPRDKVLAVVMRLINSLYFRVGTDLSADRYKTFGITTLQKRHLTIGKKGKLVFEFVGKSHVQHRKVIVDEELALIIRELSSLGRGRKLFRSVDPEGKIHPITPSHINFYIKAATGTNYSSKDFRTWGGTVLAAVKLAEIGPAKNDSLVQKNIARAVKGVAEELGNTPAVCRSSYIHPIVLDAYTSGITIADFRPHRARRIRKTDSDLDSEELSLTKLFESFR